MKTSIAILILCCAASTSFAADVVKHPDLSSALSQRWEWAIDSAKQKGLKRFWIGYSITRLMGENEWVVSGGHTIVNGRVRFSDKHPPLQEIITGTRVSKPRTLSNKDVRKEAERVITELEGKERTAERMVSKQLGILILYSSGVPSELSLNNLELPFDLERHTLIWLGTADTKSSISLLASLYEQAEETDDDLEFLKMLISAISSHQEANLMLPFLKKVLTASNEEIRAHAAITLSDVDYPEALSLLRQLITNDSSPKVREHAVVALSDMKVPGASDLLMQLAQQAEDQKVREIAVSMIADKSPQTALPILRKIAFYDTSKEIQEQALSALADLRSGSGISTLIEAAKDHPDKDLRELAVHLLSDSKDPRAKKALKDLAQQN